MRAIVTDIISFSRFISYDHVFSFIHSFILIIWHMQHNFISNNKLEINKWHNYLSDKLCPLFAGFCGHLHVWRYTGPERAVSQVGANHTITGWCGVGI